jgi:DNA polymerase
LENYVAQPDFTVTAMAWAFDDEAVRSIVWPLHRTLPPDVLRHLIMGGRVQAWNAAFEVAVLKAYFDVEIENWSCTMQRSSAYGLPMGLLAAGRAIKAPRLKDESKRGLMLQMSRPRKTKAGNAAPWHETDRERLAELAAYCRDDVEAERAIGKLIPELDPFERRLSLLDAAINRRGILVDQATVAALKVPAEVEVTKLKRECATLTNGTVTSPGTQSKRLLAWLRSEGAVLAGVGAPEVDKALSTASAGLNSLTRRVLEIRQLAARSSLAKLDKMQTIAGADGRVRHLLQFYGAGRTGRWAGRQVQPQNLPRPNKDFTADQVISVALRDPSGVELLWASPLEAISQALRGCFVAPPGKLLVAIDLSQIEARVLCWLAKQEDALAAFRKYDRTGDKNDDVYTLAARKVGSPDRQLGKVMTLGLGYSMGPDKFILSAAKGGIKLGFERAQDLVWAWRDGNPRIKGLWYALERAFSESIAHPGRIVKLVQCSVSVRTLHGVTQMKKPNGVKLTYHATQEDHEGMTFWGVEGLSKQWRRQHIYGGRITENLVQSVARDIMAEAMLRSGSVPVMTIHDEVIWEVEAAEGLQAMVNKVPDWARGLPVASSQYVGLRYGK